ncbi:hypothetical protein [Brevundimonas sp. UBA7664]|uniref:hypothetical protein n=1 Tax=Brevundimonas sp. UBA7664 TaxID=1946141 RepID=UPI0025B93B88|nr:hypothetical protein [Brevundimonas sp. UBA7664]
MDNPFAAVVAELDYLGQDNALLNCALHKNPDFVRWCERVVDRQHEASKGRVMPFPAFADVLALEATIFDNGEDKKFRHKLTLKAYTGPRIKSWKRPDWTATATLWPYDVAVKTAKRSKAKFTDATLALIEEMAAGGSGYIGVFMHTGGGSAYNDLHVVWVDLTDNRAMVYTPNCQCWLAPFETTDAKNKPLKGNAMLHSRSSSAMALDHWATGDATPL